MHKFNSLISNHIHLGGQQIATTNTVPILVFPPIQPWLDESSFLGQVYSRQTNESVNCENSAMSFVMRHCPISTTFRNPASAHYLLNLSCCCDFSTLHNRSSFMCKIIIIFQQHVYLHQIWHERRTPTVPRSIVEKFKFFTYFWDCTEKTELIFNNNCAETILVVSWSAQHCINKFPQRNMLRLDVSSMHCTCIVPNAIHANRSILLSA